VRELENVIGHAAMMTLSDTIDVSDLHEYLQTPAGHQEEQAPPTVLGADSLETQERVLIMRALESARGNQTEAARILHISRDRLRYKVKKYRLNRPASRQAFVAAV
jgi:two-component system, NtrC family, response regulator